MNNKGQAFIESVLLLGIVTFACITLIRLGLHLQNKVLLDDLLEESLICKLQKNENCLFLLKNKLDKLNYKFVEINDYSRPGLARIKLHTISGLEFSSTLESELSLGLQAD